MITTEAGRGRPRSRANSAVIIANLLSTEGFTEHVASEVRRYSLKNATKDQLRRWERDKRIFREMTKNLSETDKLVMGKYFATLIKQSFDTGLRIGLTTALYPNEESADDLH